MPRVNGFNKRLLAAAVLGALLALAGGLVYAERTALRSWYYVRGLAHADEAGRAAWVERVAGVGEDAVPDLLARLSDPDPAVCRNTGAGLTRLSGQWGSGDPRTVALALRCGREFHGFSEAGRQSVLEQATAWFREEPAETPPAPGLLPACVRFVTEAAPSADVDTQDRALALTAALLAQPQGAEALSAARDLVRQGLASASAANRLRALQLALHPGMDLFGQVVALLNDPAAEVRRAAVVAVGPLPDAVLDDALLPSLHDEDAGVRRLCEVALQGRGRSPAQIRLAFLLTAPDPVVRIQVLEQLQKVPDVDPGVWLARLSHDPSPAIRAVAARALRGLNQTERLDEMARTDPSATVCDLAKWYLANPQRRD